MILPITADCWFRAGDLSLSDGDPVSIWTDISGNGNNATQSGTARPTFRTNRVAGLPALVFDGVNDRLTLTTTLSTAARTIYFVAKHATGTGGDGLIGNVLYQNGGWLPGSGANWFADTSIFGAGANRQTRRNGVACSASFMLLPTSWEVITFPSITDGAVGFADIGAYYAGSSHWNGEIAEVIISAGVDSLPQIHCVEEYLMRKYQIRPATTSTQVIFEGDSLSAGQGGSAGTGGSEQNSYPGRICLATAGYYCQQSAISGDTAANILATWDARYENHTGTARTVYVLWIGTNDVYNNSRTGAQLYADVSAICAKARSKGWKVVVATLIDRGGTGGAGRVRADDFNALLKAGWQSIADGLVDLSGIAELGPVGAALNMTYFSTDNVHLMDASQVILVNAFTPVIQALALQ